MKALRLLDLYCGAGGASMGYSLAGFDVTGVDINPQPRYPFTFHRADALDFPLAGFDAIHASPPCQHYANVTRWRGDQAQHPDLIPPCYHRGVMPFMHKGERAYADALGCAWMTGRDAREAVPPAYTQHIGEQLRAYIGAAVGAS